MPDQSQESYAQRLQGEAAIWSANKRTYHANKRPDWVYLRELPEYWILRRNLEQFYNRIRPGDQILELGCGAGCQALEMARHGANVLALDIAEGALDIAKTYYAQIKATEGVKGTVTYQVADVNHMESITDRFDWIVMSGVLHHMPDPPELLTRCKRLLKPDGGLFISDPLDTTFFNSLFVGLFLLVLPTNLSYKEKFLRLVQIRGEAVKRMGVAIEQRGLSPFEGVGRTDFPRDTIAKDFIIERYNEGWGINGFLAQELNGPRWLQRNLLRLLAPLDWLLVKTHVIRGLRYITIAHPKM